MSLKRNYRRQLALGEDKLEEGSVRDHKDDKEGEGEGNLLEGLHNPKQSQTKGLKNGEENHPENARFIKCAKKGKRILTARSSHSAHRTLEGGASLA